MAFKMKGSSLYGSPLRQSKKTNSKVVSEDIELSIAAKKTAADIGKNGNKGKKISDYTPEQLKLIRNKKYQAKLSKELDAEMKRNPDTTGQ